MAAARARATVLRQQTIKEEDPSPPEVSWYYLDSIGQEYGPVKSKAMRGWLTQGCFPVGGDLLVRLPEWQWHMPLYTVFPNLSVAFLVPPLWPGFAPKSLWAELRAPLQWQTENPMNEPSPWANAASSRPFGELDPQGPRSFSTLPHSTNLLAPPVKHSMALSKPGIQPVTLSGPKGREAPRRAAAAQQPAAVRPLLPGTPWAEAVGRAPTPAAAGLRRCPSPDAAAADWQQQHWPWPGGTAPQSGYTRSAPSRGPAAALPRAGWGGGAGGCAEQPELDAPQLAPSAAWDGAGGRGALAASRSLPPQSWRQRGLRIESPLPPAAAEGRQHPAGVRAAASPPPQADAAAYKAWASAKPHFEPPAQSGRRFSGIIRISETDSGKGTIISPEAKRVYGGESPLITDVGGCKDGDEVVFRVRIGEGGVPEVNSLMRLTSVNPRMPPEAKEQGGPAEPPKTISGEEQQDDLQAGTGLMVSSAKACADFAMDMVAVEAQ